MRKADEVHLHEFQLKMERGLKQQCQLCQSPFSVFKKQHVCKRCYRSVCYECSPFKVKTYKESRQIGMHRNCNICYKQSLRIQEYIQQNRLHFSHDSDLMYVWSKVLQDRKILKVKRNKSVIKTYINLQSLWKSLNYSLRQLMGRLVQKQSMQDGDLIKIICNGIQQIEDYCVSHVDGGLYIYLYFLCHCQLVTAVNLTILVLEYLNQSSFTKQNLSLMVSNIGFSEVQEFKLVEFALDTPQYISHSATINNLPVMISTDIINMMLTKKNISLLWRGVFIVFRRHKEKIIDKLHSPNKLKLELLRSAANFNLKLQEQLFLVNNSISQNDQYNTLLKNYEEILLKNKEMVRQTEELKGRLKQQQMNNFLMDESLNDSIFDPDKTNLKRQFNEEHYHMLIQLKSQQIIKLKESNLVLSKENSQVHKELAILRDEVRQKRSALQKNEEKVGQIQKQKQLLKNSNSLLMIKMRELSSLIMDKQEAVLNENEQKIQKLKKLYDQMQTEKEECAIY